MCEVSENCVCEHEQNHVWCVRINRKFFAAILIEKVVVHLAKLRVSVGEVSEDCVCEDMPKNMCCVLKSMAHCLPPY